MANYTQKAILSVFEEMLAEMPFDKISVTAIVARCEISSNTFYYHFRDIYDLLDTWLDIKLSKYQGVLGDACLSDRWKAMVKNLIRDIQNSPAKVNHLFYSISRDRLERYVFCTLEISIYNMVQRRSEGLELSDEKQRMLTGVLCYSLVGFMVRFIWGGMKANVDEYFDPVLDYLDKGITQYVQHEILG